MALALMTWLVSDLTLEKDVRMEDTVARMRGYCLLRIDLTDDAFLRHLFDFNAVYGVDTAKTLLHMAWFDDEEQASRPAGQQASGPEELASRPAGQQASGPEEPASRAAVNVRAGLDITRLLNAAHNAMKRAAQRHGVEGDPMLLWIRKADVLLRQCFAGVFLECQADLALCAALRWTCGWYRIEGATANHGRLDARAGIVHANLHVASGESIINMSAKSQSHWSCRQAGVNWGSWMSHQLKGPVMFVSRRLSMRC